MNQAKLETAAKSASVVTWFSFPRVIAYAMFALVDVLIEILGELKRMNGTEGAIEGK